MEILAVILAVVGAIISFVGGIWFLVEAFRESIWWGLGCLFLPIVSLIFLIVHWAEARKPFVVVLLGNVLVFIATLIAPELFQHYGM